ncbi:MAG: hypothetical protein AAF639_47200 [Chloroflexota bacterium]
MRTGNIYLCDGYHYTVIDDNAKGPYRATMAPTFDGRFYDPAHVNDPQRPAPRQTYAIPDHWKASDTIVSYLEVRNDDRIRISYVNVFAQKDVKSKSCYVAHLNVNELQFVADDFLTYRAECKIESNQTSHYFPYLDFELPEIERWYVFGSQVFQWNNPVKPMQFRSSIYHQAHGGGPAVLVPQGCEHIQPDAKWRDGAVVGIWPDMQTGFFRTMIMRGGKAHSITCTQGPRVWDLVEVVWSEIDNDWVHVDLSKEDGFDHEFWSDALGF